MTWKYGRPVVEQYHPIPQNVIVWEGPSLLNGDPIFVIATARNANRKIGEMVQIWIITRISPIAAVKLGKDDATCGDCKMRGDGNGKGRACYVEYWREVENIWQGSKNPKLTTRMSPPDFAQHVAGLQLRIGAYGDPVAVPMHVWDPMLAQAGGWTAYTHQWKRAPDVYKRFCMASVDTHAEQMEAASTGWRTFRVRAPWEPQRVDEIICPYEEGKTVCGRCELCRGTARPAKNILVTVHGRSHIKFFSLSRPAQSSGEPRLKEKHFR